jgi:hypothetical protein
VIDIAKGVIAGGWALLVGWLLPTAINITVFGVLVLPSLQNKEFHAAQAIKAVASDAWVVVGATILLGLLLHALYRPLYRILEGYTLWPQWLHDWGHNRQIERKARLEKRVSKLESKKAHGDTTWLRVDLVKEKLHSYPSEDDQIAPTRLGNAIRRFETYALNRYRFDSQTLWYELSAVAPAEINRQGDMTRGVVDLFVCLLYGHLLVLISAVAAIFAGYPNGNVLTLTAVILAILARLWYSVACASAVEWSKTQRALANLGRKPLAEAFGLKLPETINEERDMWELVTSFVQHPYSDDYVPFDQYRVAKQEEKKEEVQPAIQQSQPPRQSLPRRVMKELLSSWGPHSPTAESPPGHETIIPPRVKDKPEKQADDQ